MELFMQNALTDNVIKQAALLYGVDVSKIVKIGGFENFVYEYTKNSENYIMRFVHSEHRTYEQVLAELEFIDYLDKNNACVSTVVHSVNDQLIERINIDDIFYFNICVFTKAPGTFVKREDQTNDFWVEFGKDVGQLHKLTKSYKPVHKRVEWNEENFFDMVDKSLPKTDDIIKERLDDLTKKILSFPKNIDNYGLIHTDLHFGNMFISSGKLTFFDWDDSSYKHFLSDIAIIIFYSFGIRNYEEDHINNETRRILALFMEGYKIENKVSIDFFKNLNDFLMLRTIILYVVIHAAGRESLDHPFGKQYIDKYRDSIISNTPFLNLDYVIKGL